MRSTVIHTAASYERLLVKLCGFSLPVLSRVHAAGSAAGTITGASTNQVARLLDARRARRPARGSGSGAGARQRQFNVAVAPCGAPARTAAEAEGAQR